MPAMRNARVGVIGVGNVYASDDGVGIRVIRRLRESVVDRRVEVIESERGCMDLLDQLAGLDAALIVDAALTGEGSAGEVTILTIQAPFHSGTSNSLHTVDLRGLLAFGEATNMKLPREIVVIAVEAKDIETFRDACTPEVDRAVPGVADRVVAEVRRLLPDVQILSGRCETACVG